MASCVRCGAELPATARFCPTCGRPVEPEFGPPPPPSTPSVWAGFRPPDWATNDWPLVAAGAAVLLGAVFALSVIVGAVAAVAVSGEADALPCGAGVGAHLAFAAFGARTVAACRSTTGTALAISFLPLFWAFASGLATAVAMRFAWSRLPDDRRRRIGYAAKLAVVTGIALGVIAGIVAGGNPRGGSSFGSSLNGGEVWFYTTVLTWFWGWLALRRRAVRLVEGRADAVLRWRPYKHMAGDGAVAFGLLAAGLAVVGLVFGLVVADGGPERLGIVIGFPVVGLSLGAALADAAMGAALAGVTGHSSLLHFGLPARPGSGAAPLWLFVVLLLAPALVGLAVWRRLDRERPADEQRALATGAVVAGGFGVTAWLAALIGRITLVAYVGPNRDSGWFSAPPAELRHSVHGVALVARPDPGSVLGLGLLWGLIGGVGAAAVWAVRHGARWPVVASADAGRSAVASSPAGAPPPSPPTPTATPPAGAPPPPPPTPATTPPAGPPTSSPPPPAAAPSAGGPPSPPPAAGPTAWLLPESVAAPDEAYEAAQEPAPPERPDENP